MESRPTAMGGGVRGWRDQTKRERTHGHGQQCGDCRVERSIRGINNNGKKYIYIYKRIFTFSLAKVFISKNVLTLIKYIFNFIIFLFIMKTNIVQYPL